MSLARIYSRISYPFIAVMKKQRSKHQRHLSSDLSSEQNIIPHARVKICGFALDDYDMRTVNLSIWKIIKWFEATRKLSFDDHTLLPYFHGQGTIVLVSTHLSINKGMYVPMQKAIDFPMNFDSNVKHIGKTSYRMDTVCYEAGSKPKILGQCAAVLVLVDPNNRRPMSLPEWFIHKYTTANQIPPSRLKQSDIPHNAHKYTTVVSYSDMDHNQHTHHPVYLRYCMDGATSAMEGRQLHNFRGDVCSYKVKEVETLYSGESKAGDAIDVMVWEDNHDKVLYFTIRRDNLNIFHCKMQFYNHNESKL